FELYTESGVGIDWVGSGAAVAKSADTCFIITDQHVARGTVDQQDKISMMSFFRDQDIEPKIEATSWNGKKYPATIGAEDPAHDLAILKLKTGNDTDAVCKAAAIAADSKIPAYDETLFTVGYPGVSATPYMSYGYYKGVASLQWLADNGGVDYGD